MSPHCIKLGCRLGAEAHTVEPKVAHETPTSNLDETVNEVLRFAQQSIVCHVPGIEAGDVVRTTTGQPA
jgi:hypothetical protein